MSNMSYCRFQNTVSDLTDCDAALEEFFAGNDEPLSRDELRAAVQLVEACRAVMMRVADKLAGLDIEFDDVLEIRENVIEDMMRGQNETVAESAKDDGDE